MENQLPGEKAGMSAELNGIDPLAAVADLMSQASEASDESRTLFEPPKPKGKRGRPKKVIENDAPPQGGAESPEIPVLDSTLFIDPCKTLFNVASAGLVRYAGTDAVKLMPEEIQGLGEAWAKVCAKYAPLFVSQNVELIFAVGMTAQVGFRISNAIQNEIEKRQAEQARTVEVVGNPVKNA